MPWAVLYPLHDNTILCQDTFDRRTIDVLGRGKELIERMHVSLMNLVRISQETEPILLHLKVLSARKLAKGFNLVEFEKIVPRLFIIGVAADMVYHRLDKDTKIDGWCGQKYDATDACIEVKNWVQTTEGTEFMKIVDEQLKKSQHDMSGLWLAGDSGAISYHGRKHSVFSEMINSLKHEELKTGTFEVCSGAVCIQDGLKRMRNSLTRSHVMR